MARKSMTPVTQVVNNPTPAQVPVVTTPAPAPVVQNLPPIGDVAFAAQLGARPYNTWTPVEKQWNLDHEKFMAKAGSGGITYLGLDETGTVLNIDIKLIDQTLPNAKRSGDNRRYLFAVDGQVITIHGVKYNLSSFYALAQK